MSQSKQNPSGNGREIARLALIIYLGLIAAFEVSRFDSAASETGLSVSSSAPSANALDIINAHHICPAQIFAQPVASPGIVTTRINVPDGSTFLFLHPRILQSFEPAGSYSTRAPPQA
ncbi:MAG: hypothetical protein M1469_08800 [Bacteroidetes bacterium]|nr:hypothetical protein [Bacteroidota bacterium]